MNDIVAVVGLAVLAFLTWWAWDYIDFNDAFRGRDKHGRRGMSPDDVVKKFTRDADDPYDGRPD